VQQRNKQEKKAIHKQIETTKFFTKQKKKTKRVTVNHFASSQFQAQDQAKPKPTQKNITEN
jgi:hypothetical protein